MNFSITLSLASAQASISASRSSLAAGNDVGGDR